MYVAAGRPNIAPTPTTPSPRSDRRWSCRNDTHVSCGFAGLAYASKSLHKSRRAYKSLQECAYRA
eukprot:3250269-Pyramimonas_sp.AAC.1